MSKLTLPDRVWHAIGEEYLTAPDATDVTPWQTLAAYFDRVVGLTQYRPTVVGRVYRYRDVRWIAVDNGEPYADVWAMADAARFGGPVEVSALYCEHPVFTVDQNVRFRVWHDTAHIENREGFSRNEELRLFPDAAAEVIRRAGSATQSAHDAALVMFSESIGQLAAAVVLGDFPAQRAVLPGPVGREVFADLLHYAGV